MTTKSARHLDSESQYRLDVAHEDARSNYPWRRFVRIATTMFVVVVSYVAVVAVVLMVASAIR